MAELTAEGRALFLVALNLVSLVLVGGASALKQRAHERGHDLRGWLLWVGALLTVAWCAFYGLIWAASGIMSPAMTATIWVFAAAAPTLVLSVGITAVAVFRRWWSGLLLPAAVALVGSLCASSL